MNNKCNTIIKKTISLLLTLTLVLGLIPEKSAYAAGEAARNAADSLSSSFEKITEGFEDLAERFKPDKDLIISKPIDVKEKYDGKRGLIVKYKETADSSLKSALRDSFRSSSGLKNKLNNSKVSDLQSINSAGLRSELETGLNKLASSKLDFSLKFTSDKLDIDIVMADSESEVSKLKSYLEDLPGVEYVQEDFELEVTALPVNDEFPLQWYSSNTGQEIEGHIARNGVDLNLLPAWELTEGSSDVVVGILDSGIDLYHECLKDSIWINNGEIPDNGIDDDNNGYIDDVNGWDFSNDDNTVYDGPESDKHGTTMAGLIAGSDISGEIKGAASGVKVMPLKFISGNKGYTSDAIKAISYARDKGVTLINCSFSGSDNNQALYEAMKDSGILFVCGAGNSAKDTSETPVYPAAFDLDNIISVAAVDVFGVLADFSAYGKNVDIAAPGCDIRTTIPSNGYGYVTGTSASAALVTGLLALGKSYLPSLSWNELKTRLYTYATECTNLKDKVTYGRADAFGLLTGNKRETDDYEGPGVASGLTPYVGEDADTWYVINELASGVERFHYGNSGVTPSTGNYSAAFTDHTVFRSGDETAIVLSRTYNSRDDEEGILGRGYRLSFEGKIKEDGKYVTVILPTGSNVSFKREDDGSYTGLYSRAKLSKENGCYKYTSLDLTEYDFDSKGRLVSISDRYGNKTVITLNKNGKPEKVREATGKGFDFAYNADGRLVSADCSDGTKVEYTYNKKKLLSKVTYPSGMFMSFEYDSEKYLNKVVDGEGRTILSLTYTHGQGDAKDKVTALSDSDGGNYTYTYDEKGRKTTITKKGETAKTWVYYYDAMCENTSIVDPDGLIERFEYTYESAEKYYGDLRSYTDRYGNITSFDIDSEGNVIKTTYPDGSEVKNTYDSFRNKLSEITGEGKTTYYVYSNDGKYYLGSALALKNGSTYAAAKTAVENWNADVATYDASVSDYSITSVTYITGAAITSGAAIKGLKESVRDAAGDKTLYTYDASGNLLTESRLFNGAFRNIASYTYNKMGRKISYTDGEGNTENYAYDEDGQLINTLAKDGGVTELTFDKSGLPVRKVTPNSDDIYTYGANGKIVKVVNIQGGISEYSYDDEGRVIREKDLKGATYAYEYDNLDRVTRKSLITVANGKESKKTLAEYSYEKNTKGGIVTTEKDYLVGEDEIKNTISSEEDGANKASDYVEKVSITDCMGRTVKEYVKGSKKDALKIVTAYDRDGNIKIKTRPDGSKEITERDIAGRVIRTYEPQTIINGETFYKRTDYVSDNGGRTLSKKVYVENVPYNGTSERYTEERYYYEDGSLRYQEITGRDYKANADGSLSLIDIQPVITTLATDLNGNVLRTYTGVKSDLSEGLDLTEVSEEYGKSVLKEVTDDDLTLATVVIDYTYDAAGRETLRKTYAKKTDGTTGAPILVRHEYNTAGDVILSSEDADIATFTYDYKKGITESTSTLLDEKGALLETLNVTVKKNAAGLVTSQTTERTCGGEKDTAACSYEYDVFGNVVLTNDAEGGTTLSRFNWLGGETLRVSANNYKEDVDPYTLSRTEFSYGENGKTVSERIYDVSIDTNTPATWHTFNYDLSGNLTKTADAFGNGITYTFYPNGKKASEKTERESAKGKSGKIYDYDALGNAVSEKDSYGEKVFVYNAFGSLLKESVKEIGKPEITKNTYEYDILRRCVKKTDALGCTTAYEYDNLGRCVKETVNVEDSANRLVNTYSYDEYGNAVRKETSLGLVAENAYNSKKNVIKTKSFDVNAPEDQITESFEYDLLGNKISYTNANGVKTEYRYDHLNRLTSETFYGDITKTTAYEYDHEGHKVKTTDWRGNSTLLTYDALGRLVVETNALGDDIRTITYDKAGREISELDGEKNKTTYSYDLDGNLTETKDALGGSTKDSYDYRGRLKKKTVKITDDSSSVTTFYYDALDNLTGVTDSYGNYTEYVYDNAGNVTKQIDAAGNVITFEYNNLGKLVKRTDANEKNEYFTYRPDGLLSTQTQKSGTALSYTYDAFGRVLKEEAKNKAGRTESHVYTYDKLGNKLSSALEKDGKVTSLINYTYDKEGRLTSKETEGVGKETVSYDNIHDDYQIVIKSYFDTKDNLLNAAVLLYDKLNRETFAVEGDENVYSIVENPDSIPLFKTFVADFYNRNGAKDEELKILELNKESGIMNALCNRFIYDKARNLIEIQHANSNDDTTSFEQYEYDLNHNVIKEIRTDNSVASEGAITTTISYEYDLLGQLVKVSEKDKTTEYAYDTIGNRTAKVVTYADAKLGKVVTLYEVDAAGRLLSARCSDGTDTTYGYDGNDNTVIVARSAKKTNAETVTEATGNLLIEEADENGNIVAPSSSQLSETLDSLTVNYTYDLFNRLLETKTVKKTVSFSYEADGYRHSKSTVTPSSEENIVYFYEGDHVAFEEDETGNVTAVNHYGTSHYARTIYEGEEETTFYYQFNAYGDVTALIGTDGSTITKYEYDAFGNLTSQPDVRVNNSITYRGYEYDSETGLYYLNARYYDSETARFLTEDTYRGEKNDPLSLNLYTYCKNNPLKYTDPTGHSFKAQEMSSGTNVQHSEKAKKENTQREKTKREKAKRDQQLSDVIVSLLRGATLTVAGVALCLGATTVGAPLLAVAAYTAATASLGFGLSDISQGVDGISKYSSTKGEYKSDNFIRDYGFNGDEGAYVGAEMLAVDVGDFSVNYGDATWNWLKGLANKYYNKAKNALNRVFGSNNPKSTIPEKVFNVLDDIKKNNGAPSKGYKGGRTYKNIPVDPGAQKLPGGGITYREYDVNPYIKGQNRGAERLVIGSDGSAWYTKDHYFTFERVE